jgi:hypothetical protein
MYLKRIKILRKILKKKETNLVCLFEDCNNSYPTFYKWSTHHRTHVNINKLK